MHPTDMFPIPNQAKCRHHRVDQPRPHARIACFGIPEQSGRAIRICLVQVSSKTLCKLVIAFLLSWMAYFILIVKYYSKQYYLSRQYQSFDLSN